MMVRLSDDHTDAAFARAVRGFLDVDDSDPNPNARALEVLAARLFYIDRVSSRMEEISKLLGLSDTCTGRDVVKAIAALVNKRDAGWPNIPDREPDTRG